MKNIPETSISATRESLSLPDLSSRNSFDTPQSTDQKFININLYGRIFKLNRHEIVHYSKDSFLKRFALSSQEEKEKIADYYCPRTEAYYFARSPIFFEYILNFLSTGNVHCPPMVCPDMFLAELQFWEIRTEHVSVCCRERLGLPEMSSRASIEEDTEIGHSNNNGMIPNGNILNGHAFKYSIAQDQFSGICCSNVRRTLWNVLENPASSTVAKGFAGISVGLIVVSVVTLILGSMKEFQKDNKEPIEILVYIEYTCVVWFTVEYFARLLLVPEKWKFLKSLINIIDAMSIFPFYVEFLLMASGKNASELSNLKGALLAMRVLRVLRVARVFRLARYSGGLQSFIQTLTSSHKEIGMLMMFLSTGVLLFSTTVYFMEKDATDSPFTSIPATFWWAIVTMTTVGYGDMIPVTLGGKLVASFATIAGVIVLAFPITMIVENFCRHYQMDVYVNRPSEPPPNTSEPEKKLRRLHVKSAGIL